MMHFELTPLCIERWLQAFDKYMYLCMYNDFATKYMVCTCTLYMACAQACSRTDASECMYMYYCYSVSENIPLIHSTSEHNLTQYARKKG